MAAIPHKIVVHVIEGRALVGLDQSGTSDALCVVEVGPKSKRRKVTVHQPETNNALWEKAFVFEDVWLTEEEFISEKIAFKVFDRNNIWRNELIGAVELSLSFVHRKKTRSVQSAWLPLHLPSDPQEPRGQLRASVYVLRPGDPPPTFIPSTLEDGGAVLQVPPSHHKPFQLNVLIYRAEEVLCHRKDIVNPFLSIRFNGNSARTSTRPNQTNPVFNRRFEIPFYIPVTSDSIEIMLWNELRGRPDELIGTARFAQNELTYKPWGPKWICFYTHPQPAQGLIGSIMDRIQGDAGPPSEYAGRALIRLSVASVKRPKLLSVPLDAMSDEPLVAPCMVKIQMYNAIDVPVNGGQACVEVRFGSHRIVSPYVRGKAGLFKWNHNFQPMIVSTPTDALQAPDLILSIYHRVGIISTKLAFIRLKAADLMPGDDAAYRINGDVVHNARKLRPYWRCLRPCRYRDDNIVSGFISFAIASGEPSLTLQRLSAKPLLRLRPQRLVLRAHMIQAVNVPAATNVGLSNVVAVIRVAGSVGTTSTVPCTLYPRWDQMVEVEIDVDPDLSPHISVLLFHRSGMSLVFLARTELALPKLRSKQDRFAAGEREEPDTSDDEREFLRYPLYFSDEPDYCARDSYLLASFEVVTPREAKTRREQDNARRRRAMSSLPTQPLGILVQTIGVRGLGRGTYSLEVGVPDLREGRAPSAEMVKTIGPVKGGGGEGLAKGNEFSSSSSKSCGDLRKTLRFNNVPVPIEHLDGFAISFRVFEHGLAGKSAVAHSYLPLSETMCRVQGESIEAVEVESEAVWYTPDQHIDQSEDGLEGSDDEDGDIHEGHISGKADYFDDDDEGDVRKTKELKTVIPQMEPGNALTGSSRAQSPQAFLALDIESLNVSVTNMYTLEKAGELDQIGVDGRGIGDAEVNDGDDVEAQLAALVAMSASEDADMDGALNREWIEADRLRSIQLFAGQDVGLTSTDRAISDAKRKTSQISSVRPPLSKRKQVAVLKAVVMSTRHDEFQSVEENREILDVLKQTYVARLYVYRCINLPPRDAWVFEERTLPYLVICNGSDREHNINDKASIDPKEVDDLNPQLCRTFQLNCRFPENSIIDLAVWHNDMFGVDSFIGNTKIDIEQRLVNPIWRSLKPSQRREHRVLYASGNNLAHGKVDLRLDVLDWQDAQEMPPENLARAQSEPFEFRFVIWTTRDVHFHDDSRQDEIDQQVTVSVNFEGVPGQDTTKTTDTAWNAGSDADWNYRMTFPVTLPCKVPRVKITVWDANFIGREVIGDVLMNLTPKFEEAYHEKRRVVHMERQWLQIQHPDAPGKNIGDINCEFWAVARDEADAAPVGEGQNAPNRDPYLPKPSRKPPPWALGSRLLNTMDMFAKRKTLLMIICFLIIVVPLALPLLFGKLNALG